MPDSGIEKHQILGQNRLFYLNFMIPSAVQFSGYSNLFLSGKITLEAGHSYQFVLSAFNSVPSLPLNLSTPCPSLLLNVGNAFLLPRLPPHHPRPKGWFDHSHTSAGLSLRIDFRHPRSAIYTSI